MSQHEVEQVIGEIESRISAVARGLEPGEQHFLLANKTERQLHLYDGDWRLLKSYAFTGFSGRDGPKRMEGDGQIPEGVYRITVLNPQSRFHLSMRLDYPNALDRQYNGDNPGSDIYIHGGHVTIGCIPIGDPGIEDLFYAVHRVGPEHFSVIIVSDTVRLAPQQGAYARDIQASINKLVPKSVWNTGLAHD